jgi:hypothetical protein
VTSLYEEFRINPWWVLGGHKLAGLTGDKLGAELERHLSKYRNVEINSFTRIDFDPESRSFETTTGYVGMGPEGMAKGDELYILNGCKWPVILRKRDDEYAFVGIGFVLGLMTGEASQLIRDENVAPQRILVR